MHASNPRRGEHGRLALGTALGILALAATVSLGIGEGGQFYAAGVPAAAAAETRLLASATPTPTATATPKAGVAMSTLVDGAQNTTLFFPFASRAVLPTPTPTPDACQPIAGASYGSLTINGSPTDRPAAQHPDLNLSIRGWALTSGYQGLVYYSGNPDASAPQFPSLFADRRTPAFSSLFRVYDWDWATNTRGDLITSWPVTLLGMATRPGETIAVPSSGYDIGQGYTALVLYATDTRITLKYTREDNVVYGYTVHVENVCVDPNLRNLYNSLDAAGRRSLPALKGAQPFGRAKGSEIMVAIRDAGSFMDPRSRADWWQGR